MSGAQQEILKLLDSHFRLQQFVIEDYKQSLERILIYHKNLSKRLDSLKGQLPLAAEEKKILKIIKFNNRVRKSLEDLHQSYKHNYNQFIQDLTVVKVLAENKPEAIQLRKHYEQLDHQFNSAFTAIQSLTTKITHFIDSLKPPLEPRPQKRYNH